MGFEVEKEEKREWNVSMVRNKRSVGMVWMFGFFSFLGWRFYGTEEMG